MIKEFFNLVTPHLTRVLVGGINSSELKIHVTVIGILQ